MTTFQKNARTVAHDIPEWMRGNERIQRASVAALLSLAATLLSVGLVLYS